MEHRAMEDDVDIIKKCRDYGFCCTYDPEGDFDCRSVTDAIAAVLASRARQSKRLGGIIAGTDGIMGPLQKLIDSAGELTRISNGGVSQVSNGGVSQISNGGIGGGHLAAASDYLGRLVKERDALSLNLRTLEEAKRVMDRKHIRVPIVGVINSGKSTFLHSALGGNMSDRVKENLFPSGDAHNSCTGTRTVLIYDNDSEGVRVVARFKDRPTFLNDCRQSARRMIQVLKEKLKVIDKFPQIGKLEKDLEKGADPITLLRGYYKSAEFKALCKIRYEDERDAESVYDFCSFLHFLADQDYTEDRMDAGIPKDIFRVGDLMKSWDEGTDYSIQIPSDNDFEAMKRFVCKYDPGKGRGARRYTTYCGIQVVEIRGNLCGEIAGLELVDSVGANDDAISNEDQMKALMQDSDAMILLERPQPQRHGGWGIRDCIEFVRKQEKASEQFLYLAYNSYKNTSDLSYDLDNAKKYYSRDCKRVYVSDISGWDEVQLLMLVDMLVSLSDSVEETHKKYLDLARDADANISASIQAIRQAAEGLGQACAADGENPLERRENIDSIFRTLFGEVERMAAAIGKEDRTTLRVRANAITGNLAESLKPEQGPVDFDVAYRYVSPIGPGYVYNRYVAFLCMYAHMLEEVKRQYNVLKDDIDTYVEGKRKELLKILWESGRFQSIMSGLGPALPGVGEICGWLRRDGRELLADVLEDLLSKDVRAESLIDESIGKVIERFSPENLTAEQLFGQQMSEPKLENDEGGRAAAITGQLSAKLGELKAALLESMPGNAGASSDVAGEGNTGKKRDDEEWDERFYEASESDPKPASSLPDAEENLFDLDKKVRRDVVCGDILGKFRDKLRGDGLPQGAEQPVSQLYSLYDRYYDILLTEEEVSYRKRLGELCRSTDELARQLAALCREYA